MYLLVCRHNFIYLWNFYMKLLWWQSNIHFLCSSVSLRITLNTDRLMKRLIFYAHNLNPQKSIQISASQTVYLLYRIKLPGFTFLLNCFNLKSLVCLPVFLFTLKKKMLGCIDTVCVNIKTKNVLDFIEVCSCLGWHLNILEWYLLNPFQSFS